MNIGTIVTPNSKGQIVIPKSIRDQLGIFPDTSLQIRAIDDGLLIQPVADVFVRSDVRTRNAALLEVLKKTAGAWKDDRDWPKMEAKRRKIELAATRRNKMAW